MDRAFSDAHLANAERSVPAKGLFADGPFSFSGSHFTITELDGTPKPVQPSGPPIMIGGGGRKVLSVAGRHAEIVQIMGSPIARDGTLAVDPAAFTVEAHEQRVGWVREAAGDRFGEIELCIQLENLTITDDPARATDEFMQQLISTVRQYGGEVSRDDLSVDQLMTVPSMAIGTLEEVCAKLLDVRDRFRFSYFVAPFMTSDEVLAPVIERLR